MWGNITKTFSIIAYIGDIFAKMILYNNDIGDVSYQYVLIG